MRTCPRCGEKFEVYNVTDRYDLRCALEVRTILANDAKRRAPRFSSPKDLTGQVGPL